MQPDKLRFVPPFGSGSRYLDEDGRLGGHAFYIIFIFYTGKIL